MSDDDSLSSSDDEKERRKHLKKRRRKRQHEKRKQRKRSYSSDDSSSSDDSYAYRRRKRRRQEKKKKRRSERKERSKKARSYDSSDSSAKATGEEKPSEVEDQRSCIPTGPEPESFIPAAPYRIPQARGVPLFLPGNKERPKLNVNLKKRRSGTLVALSTMAKVRDLMRLSSIFCCVA